MPDAVVTVGGFIVASILGGITLWWSKRGLRRAGVADLAGGDSPSRDEAISNLQLLADSWEERYKLEHEANVTAQTAIADALSSRAIEREMARQCRDDLAGAYERIRILERQRDQS